MSYPEKCFDLAIVDPPYGLGEQITRGGGNHMKFKNFEEINQWDKAPCPMYFHHLFRVSKNQIIWGGNYFHLPPTRGFVVWDKMQHLENFSQAEYAWTSFDCVAKVFRFRQAGCFGEKKIHPCQKPVKLYKFLLNSFAQPGDKILDTHVGSGSSRIASYALGFDYTGFESHLRHYQDQEDRFEEFKKELDRKDRAFTTQYVQQGLF